MKIERYSNNRYTEVFKPFDDKKDKNSSVVKEIQEELNYNTKKCKSNYINRVIGEDKIKCLVQ